MSEVKRHALIEEYRSSVQNSQSDKKESSKIGAVCITIFFLFLIISMFVFMKSYTLVYAKIQDILIIPSVLLSALGIAGVLYGMYTPQCTWLNTFEQKKVKHFIGAFLIVPLFIVPIIFSLPIYLHWLIGADSEMTFLISGKTANYAQRKERDGQIYVDGDWMITKGTIAGIHEESWELAEKGDTLAAFGKESFIGFTCKRYVIRKKNQL